MSHRARSYHQGRRSSESRELPFDPFHPVILPAKTPTRRQDRPSLPRTFASHQGQLDLMLHPSTLLDCSWVQSGETDWEAVSTSSTGDSDDG